MPRNRVGHLTQSRTSFAAILLAIILTGCTSYGQRAAALQPETVRAMRRVAILPLENLTEHRTAPDVVSDLLAASLYRSARYDVIVERHEVARRLSTLNQGLPPVLDRTAAIEVGRALDLDGVFYGTVVEYGDRVDRLNRRLDSVVGVTLRLVDPRSGEIVWTARANRTSGELLAVSREPLASVAQIAVADLVTALHPAADGVTP